MNDVEIQDLIIRVKKGDEKAFQSLVEEFIYLIYAVIARQARSWPDSFDHLKNDVIAIFYELILKYDPSLTSSFRKYISVALFWYVENYKNKNFSLAMRSAFVERKRFKQEGFLKEPKIFLEEIWELIETELPERLKKNFPFYREVLYLYYVKGYTQKEIAREHGCSQTLISLMLKEILQCLKKIKPYRLRKKR